ncbi:MAG TPA: ATP-binding protein [Pyrinomonadaceae bacterium]|nr:ATP-binding protein [Pyrinomonadaceae bacterium]
MKGSVLTTRSWVLLVAAALLVAAGTLNFAQRLTHQPPPTDGVHWEQTDAGLVARSVDPRSSAGRRGFLGVLPGDRLVGLSFDEEHYEQVVTVSDVQVDLETAGVGGHLTYIIERPASDGTSSAYTVPLTLEPMRHWSRRDVYVNFVGVVYLLVGLFVLFKQGGRAPFVPHFAALCLVAFVAHFYKPYGGYEDLDLAVAFLDDAAIALFAPLFLHFCAVYPVRQRLSERRRWPALLLYAPAAVLVGLTAFFYFTPSLRGASPTPSAAYNLLFSLYVRLPQDFSEWLSVAATAFITASLVAGAVVLVYRFAKSESAVVRQQLKWVVWGSAVAVTPFTLLYAVGYLFDAGAATNSLVSEATAAWLSDAAVLPLVLIPLTFGNSVVRYRLMDVDMVVRRTATYALTTLAVAAGIGLVVYTAGLIALGGESVAPGAVTMRFLVSVAAMAVIVMTAAPLKNFLQERVDRFFYGERYDMRNGLLDFGRTLSATSALEPLLDALVSRLQQVLGVERIAIFVEERATGRYRVARAGGISRELIVPPDFREMIRRRSAETGVVRADDLDLQPETTGFVRRALHYYVPCVVRGRMVAVIGLGRSTGGALLSSEDLEILRTISGYVAVAIENSLLYEEQSERAAELESLKEYNESIVESINVGLLAVDTEGRVTGCNTTLEQLLGVRRGEAVGRSVEDLFAEDFAETLAHVLGRDGWQLNELRNIYKLHTATRAGQPLILNIALAPLRRASALAADANGNGNNNGGGTPHEGGGEHTGALVVLEDVTSRVRLEEQLQQREKLSSIGLLAAGVAHEINTPLTGVSSYTQMLLGMLPETDPKHALLQKIRRQTERATGIVGNLLNFSRTGGVAELSELDLNGVLDLTLQLLEPQMRNSRVEVVREYAPELPRVWGNAGRLQQVFTNLLLNARDAIPDSGSIRIVTRGEADETVRVELIDDGIGIAPVIVARIYDPFFTTKGVGRGTGLGLAVSYGIVQEHSGHISVESAPGRGTTFRITLPTVNARARLQAASD